MQAKIIRKNRNNQVWKKLKKKIQDLDNKRVDVGFPANASGFGEWDNRSNMTFANLAFIHANADVLNVSFPKRDVMSPIKPIVGGTLNQTKFFCGIFKNYLNVKTTYSMNNALNDIGRKYTQDGKGIFGNSAYLVVTKNPTPLIDEGELMDHFGYKTSLAMEIKYL